GAEPMVSVSPENLDVMYLAGSVNFGITSNTDWTATADSTWLTVTPSGSMSGTLVANYLQNPYYAERVSTISVMVAGKEPQKVTLTQSSSELSIEESDNQGLRIFPNPTKGLFVLEVDKAKYPAMEVRLTDLYGHSVMSRNCNGEDRYIFDVNNLKQGTYSIRIKTDNNLITRKIVIIR
ncbi:MAG: hypothetical protein CVU14_12790, partial [Bacteroidetes bacterium HGW-Bacteroidetes-9]